MMIGKEIHRFAEQLWPINRSLTGDGVRETLHKVKLHCPGLEIHEVPSGTAAFDWTVPKEWRVHEAWILTPDGRKICDFRVNNLYLLGYSAPVSRSVTLEELQDHLYSLPDLPDAIPYVTSYYKERWGFCMEDRIRRTLCAGNYFVHIDSELFDGSLTYGEILIPGEVEEEIFLSTYVCHPSMANNEISGPVVATFIAKWLQSLPKRRFSYRIAFVPETIGSIVYLSRNLPKLKKLVRGGFVLTCIGDDRAYSFLGTRLGNTESDKNALHVLKHTDPEFKTYPWADRGSDERQYCAPLVDLPIASIMRSMYAQYPEYHTSFDDLERVVTPSGLQGGYIAVQRTLELFERNVFPLTTVICEPQMGKRGLYSTVSSNGSALQSMQLMNVLTWCDGNHCVRDIAEQCGIPAWEIYPILDILHEHGLVEYKAPLGLTPNIN